MASGSLLRTCSQLLAAVMQLLRRLLEQPPACVLVLPRSQRPLPKQPAPTHRLIPMAGIKNAAVGCGWLLQGAIVVPYGCHEATPLQDMPASSTAQHTFQHGWLSRGALQKHPDTNRPKRWCHPGADAAAGSLCVILTHLLH